MDRETLGVIFLAFVSLLMLFWFATSIVGWIWAAQRLLRKEQIIAVEPRSGLRPGLSDLLFAFGCFIVCLYAMQMFLVVPKLAELNAQAETNTARTTEHTDGTTEAEKTTEAELPVDNGTSASSSVNASPPGSETTNGPASLQDSADAISTTSPQTEPVTTETGTEGTDSDQKNELNLSVSP